MGTPTDSHDLQMLSNGNALLVSYRPRDGVDLSPWGGPASATVIDGEIQEVDPSGQLVWSWNSKDHIALAETGHWYADNLIPNPSRLPDGRSAYDIVHLNSVDAVDNPLVVSLRHTDAVFGINRASGAVQWKLGGITTPESLQLTGDSAMAA